MVQKTITDIHLFSQNLTLYKSWGNRLAPMIPSFKKVIF